MPSAPSAVGWCDARSPEAWSELLPAPVPNEGFQEIRQYRFGFPEPGWRFLVDDEPLTGIPGSGSKWEWTPGFYAGEVAAQLLRPDGSLAATYILDVSPDPAKLGGVVFRRMMDELLEADPALLLGEEPATTMTGELGDFQNPWIEFARLRRYAPEFLKALRPIQERPRRALRVKRDSAALHHVRRVDRRTAVSMLRSPALAMMFSPSDQPADPTSESRLDVPAIEETVDSAANRAMLSLIRALLRRARTLHSVLKARTERGADSETRTGLAARWPVRRDFLENLAGQLSLALRRSPFDEVRSAETTAAGLNAVSADPLYSRAWGRGWRALRHGIEGAGTERLWVSPSWEIYERWCFLQLGKLLQAEYPDWHWGLLRSPLRWRGESGSRKADLMLQTTFGSYPVNKRGMWSVSRERIPDIVLLVRDDDNTERFVVIDAKYRVSRSAVLDAMQSAHIYQDSLRVSSRRPEASLLVVPATGGAPWLEAADFQNEHRVGVCELSPAVEQALPAAIRAILS